MIHDCNIEGSAAQVVNQDSFVFLTTGNAIANRCCSRFINNIKYIKPCQLTSILSCLSLIHTKVSWASNNNILDFFALLDNASMDQLFICILCYTEQSI